MSDDVRLNWIPESFEEFTKAVAEKRVRLGIMPEQYRWLYDNVLPRRLFSYDRKLLHLMTTDEQVFRCVHDKGIDLILELP